MTRHGSVAAARKTIGKLTRSQRFDVARANAIIADHFSVGARPAYLSETPEDRIIAAGYEILHGIVLSREQRIELLEALAILERAGNYQPKQ